MKYEEFYEEYKKFDTDALIRLLFLKERNYEQARKREEERTKVINLIAEYIGIADKGLYLYGVCEDGATPILDELKKYLDNGGDKVKLKKRVAELENENSVLRTLITK